MTASQLISQLEFNVPFQHKYGYIRDENMTADGINFQQVIVSRIFALTIERRLPEKLISRGLHILFILHDHKTYRGCMADSHAVVAVWQNVGLSDVAVICGHYTISMLLGNTAYRVTQVKW